MISFSTNPQCMSSGISYVPSPGWARIQHLKVTISYFLKVDDIFTERPLYCKRRVLYGHLVWFHCILYSVLWKENSTLRVYCDCPKKIPIVKTYIIQ